MNEDLAKVGTAQFVKLYDCGTNACDGAKGGGDTAIFSLKAYTASTATSLKVTFGDTSKKYKLVIQGGSNVALGCTSGTTCPPKITGTSSPYIFPRRETTDPRSLIA